MHPSKYRKKDLETAVPLGRRIVISPGKVNDAWEKDRRGKSFGPCRNPVKKQPQPKKKKKTQNLKEKCRATAAGEVLWPANRKCRGAHCAKKKPVGGKSGWGKLGWFEMLFGVAWGGSQSNKEELK